MSTLRCLVYRPGQAEPVDISDQVRTEEVRITFNPAPVRRAAVDEWLACAADEWLAWAKRVLHGSPPPGSSPRAEARAARKRRGKLPHQRGRR